MAIQFADKMAWAAEQFERGLVVHSVLVSSIAGTYKDWDQPQDDADDVLQQAANLLLFATEQLEEVARLLEE